MAEKILENPAEKTCEACGARFSCGAGSDKCWCFEVSLKTETLRDLNRRYGHCLCPACLRRLSSEGANERSELVQS